MHLLKCLPFKHEVPSSNLNIHVKKQRTVVASSTGGTETTTFSESQSRQLDKSNSHVELGDFQRRTADVDLWHLHVFAQTCRHTLTCTRKQIRTHLLASLSFVAVLTGQSKPGEEMAYFISWLIAHHQGKSRQELKARTEAEATDHQRNGAHWLDLQGMLSSATQDHLPQGGTACRVLRPSTSIINQENVQVILVYVEWTQTSQPIFTTLLGQQIIIR